MNKKHASGRVIDIVTVIVSGTWAVSFLADIWVPDYESPPGLHQVMMLLVGFLVAGKTQVGKNDETPTEEKK